MASYRFRLVNAFAGDQLLGRSALTGNPLCVFEDARGLDDRAMMALARQRWPDGFSFLPILSGARKSTLCKTPGPIGQAGHRKVLRHCEHGVNMKEQYKDLLDVLESRFLKNPDRHRGIDWESVQTRLEAHAVKLRSLDEMEKSGGEPDVVGRDSKTGELIFVDCSAESPKGRRSVCYDREARESRKEHKPADSALDMAAAMRIELLTEEEYRQLQRLGRFDEKTSSWVKTPASIRKLGGALFCDRRYDTVFVYHNGAQSYYAARGFRGSIRI